jgi:hypothetical protein
MSSLVPEGWGERGDFTHSYKLPDHYYIISLPSTVLRITNYVSFQTTKDDDEFADLFVELWDKCTEVIEQYEQQQYGFTDCDEFAPSDKVKAIKIPRPVFIDRTAQNKKEDEVKPLEENSKITIDPK